MDDTALNQSPFMESPSAWKHWRYIVIPVVSIASALALIVGVVVTYLALPGRPQDSSSTHFEGFIELPRHGLLSILDYLSVQDRHLYVTNITHGILSDIALGDAGLTGQASVSEMDGPGAAHGVALTPGDGVGYLTRSKINRVDVFNLESHKPLVQIPVAGDPDAILYVPQNHIIYVANGDARLATLIDTERRVVIGSIPLEGKPEFAALDTRTGLLYQNLEDVNTMVAVDVARKRVVGRWPLAPCQGPSGMAIDSGRRRLFSVCSGNAMLVVVNLDTHRVIASMAVGWLPDSVVYDETLHRIYIAAGIGMLTVIQQEAPDFYRILDRIQTHFGAHTLALDPATSKVYVAYGSLIVHPRMAVFSPSSPNALPVGGDVTQTGSESKGVRQ